MIALADDSGAVTATTRFDAFGNVLGGTAVSDGAAMQAAGDWSWKGMWMDSATGLYHVRARDLDPVTGRFLSRDPVEMNMKEPESAQPYAFAFSNPLMYSDPTGRFTLVEINISMNLQSAINNIQVAARHEMKEWARDQVMESVSEIISKSLAGLVPGGHTLLTFINGYSRTEQGSAADTLLKVGLAGAANQAGIGGQLYFEPSIDRRTLQVTDNGTSADELMSWHGPAPIGAGTNFGKIISGSARPDFLFSPVSPDHIGTMSPAWLIGDIKLDADTLYSNYVTYGDGGQLQTIFGFCARKTMTRVAVFMTVYKASSANQQKLASLLKKQAFSKGVVAVLWSMTNRRSP